MNTKSKTYKVAPGFEDLFSFASEEERLEHRAQMISFRILSEMEKICVERDIKMKDLAKMVKTSASYVTQLFRGHKQVNTAFMARFEDSMKMIFEIGLQPEQEQQDEKFRMEQTMKELKKLKKQNPGCSFYTVQKGGVAVKTDQILENMNSEKQKNQNNLAA